MARRWPQSTPAAAAAVILALLASAGSRSPPCSAGSSPRGWCAAQATHRGRRARRGHARPRAPADVAGQDEIGRLARALQRDARRARALDGALDGCVSAAPARRRRLARAAHAGHQPAHEHRDPAEATAAELPEPSAGALLDDVEEQIEELATLVDDLIELARGDEPRRGRRGECASTSSSRGVDARAPARAARASTAEPGAGDRRRRARAPRPRRQQPARQRRQARAGGRASRSALRGGELSVRDHGPGIAAGGAAARLRPLLPRRRRRAGGRAPGSASRSCDRSPGRRRQRRGPGRRGRRPGGRAAAPELGEGVAVGGGGRGRGIPTRRGAWQHPRWMTRPHRLLLPVLLRATAREGAHAEAARRVLLWLLLARMLADAGHAGPPHPALRPPRRVTARRERRARHDALAGRRPRG